MPETLERTPLEVDRLMLTTLEVKARTIYFEVAGRPVQFRVRKPGPADIKHPVRLTVLTPTTKGLPEPRTFDGGTVRILRIPRSGNVAITVMLDTHPDLGARLPNIPDDQLCTRMLELVHDYLPGHILT